MKSILWIAVAFGLVVVAAPAFGADEVKEVKVDGFKPRNEPTSRFTQTGPGEFKDEEAVDRAFTQKNHREQIKKQVDFSKQKLVWFAWSGSGQDKLTAELVKGDAVFTYKPGTTRDLRGHYRIFVVPKSAEIKVDAGKSSKK